ncbi:MAG: hypothetical protein EXS39_05810 [Opitutaceae bacterium]|nr:hypothetical protein [Opitutaceae bacterium]
MPTLGLELCDAGLLTVVCDKNEIRPLAVPDRNGATDWPGFVYHEGSNYTFGRAAEDMWFVHPRRVAHTFWAKLAHDSSSSLIVVGRSPPFSELAFLFLREFTGRLTAAHGSIEKIVLAVPGSYLGDPATEDEKIGLLLGLAHELKLPLAGIVDLACAALCDPRAPGFNPALPIIVVDVQLEGTDLTLLAADEQLERKQFLHLAGSGYAQLFKHLTATMGNRFLRHTAFDILEDGRVEQMFFSQTRDFLLGHAAEHRYQINTATRNYEMPAKYDQLAGDAQAFVATVVHGLQTFVDQAAHAPGLCTIALTSRTAALPGIEAKLRAAGFLRQLRLPAAAAAAGAARIGETRLGLMADLGDVPVAVAVPVSDTQRAAATKWEARLQKTRHATPRPAPTHAIFDGLGHVIGSGPHFTIGPATLRADVALPENFSSADDCIVPLVREGGRLWFVDPTPTDTPVPGGAAPRVVVEAGDRLTIRCGPAAAEVLFVHVPAMNGSHA